MYKVKYISENGATFLFDARNNVVFDMDLGNGLSTNLGKSQGFEQVGEVVQTKSVSGKPISVSGSVYGDVYQQKVKMRNIFTPMSKGKLIFQDGHYINVEVQESPTFSTAKTNPQFTMLFYAPYPFFSNETDSTAEFGKIKPTFKFPINYYTKPHKFGVLEEQRVINIKNNGNVKALYNARIQAKGTCTNIKLTDLETLEFIQFNVALQVGHILELRQDENGTRLYRIIDDIEEEVTYLIDEKSNLFTFDVGDNVISALDDEGDNAFNIRITYNEGVTAVYEA